MIDIAAVHSSKRSIRYLYLIQIVTCVYAIVRDAPLDSTYRHFNYHRYSQFLFIYRSILRRVAFRICFTCSGI